MPRSPRSSTSLPVPSDRASREGGHCWPAASADTHHRGTHHRGTRHPGTPHPGTPHPGTPHPGTPYLGTPHRPPSVKQVHMSEFSHDRDELASAYLDGEVTGAE